MKKKKEKTNLENAFSLWVNKAKSGNEYFTGKDCNSEKLIAFYTNEKNTKKPHIRIYSLNEKNERQDEVAVLWKSLSKANKEYLTGTTSEKEKLIGFYDDGNNEKAPFINVYFKD